ncbi:hypothetical protein SAMN05444487_12118 [Marininema mesophilum]|uniref:Uncharacterized protein n=1 Tax=Marininema mesophilum TaxID=1048340 RepID=A0A1H3CAK4_9BACL|nr:hypothetical protein [Marininema mesophilum]SDX51143.1 hypothetical protein SAMN05444487_12118 [Marininema mesophilum]
MQLFHYHYWTEKVEEMESFYRSLGFQVQLALTLVENTKPILKSVAMTNESMAKVDPVGVCLG